METRGRKKKTQEQKKLIGSYRSDRDDRGFSSDMTMPDCPDWLDKSAATIWDRLAQPLNKSGVLSFSDGESFALFCFWLDKFITQQKTCQDVGQLKKIMAEVDRLGAKFGYSPADRASLRVERPKEQDPLEALLHRKKIKIG